ARRIRRGRPVGRRLGQSGARRRGDDALRHARADDLSHQDRAARRRARVSGVRHALSDLPGFSSRGDPELRPRHAGNRLSRGEAVRGRGTRGPVSRSRAFVSEVNDWTRRDVLAMLAAAAWTPLVPRRGPNVTATGSPGGPTGFRVRTITAGTNLKSLADTRAL